jgi:HD superfamily phosphodiesterase
MKLSTLTPLINYAFNYVIKFSKIYNIDESHALKHSMETFRYANEIYNSEVKINPYLEEQQDIIYVSSILHDMCDKKYLSEKVGLSTINQHMSEYIPKPRLDVISNIITTMSYSKVCQIGFPKLDEYQLAYHIVREADLLSGYDIDRCIIYGMMVEKLQYNDAVLRAIDLFDKRILKYRDDKLFVTETSNKLSLELHNKSLNDIEQLKLTFQPFLKVEPNQPLRKVEPK